MSDLQITIVGNLTDEPELRYTPNGASVVNFRVAHNPREFDRQTNEWKDGTPTYFRCQAWKEFAENISETLTRGMRVVVSGKLKTRAYKTKEGEDRTVQELHVDNAGPDLRYATAKVTKAERKQAGYTGHQRDDGSWTPNRESAFNSATGRGGFGGDPNADPWATQGGTSAPAPF